MNRRHLLTLLSVATLTACGGIPLRSIPRLMQLSGDLLQAQPAEFRVAIQMDQRIAPPAASVPMLSIQLTPKVAGAFAPVAKKLPLQLAPATEPAPTSAPPGPGRKWLIYSLPPATQVELSRIQAMVRHAQSQPGYQKGGQLSLGIEQTDLALTQPQLADTEWSTWLQVKQAEGYIQVWNGTPAQLLAMAQTRR